MPCFANCGKLNFGWQFPRRFGCEELSVSLGAFEGGTNPVLLSFEDSRYLVGVVPAWNYDF
jgi:hypothetical protein